jgi:hypothetical protein
MAKHEKIRAYSFRESVIHFVTQRLLHGSTWPTRFISFRSHCHE